MKPFRAFLAIVAATAFFAFMGVAAQKKPEDPIDGIIETGAYPIDILILSYVA